MVEQTAVGVTLSYNRHAQGEEGILNLKYICQPFRLVEVVE